MLRDCQEFEVVAQTFPPESADVFDRVILKVHSTLPANHTWSAFVPLCRRSYSNIQRELREQGIFHIFTICVQVSPKWHALHSHGFQIRKERAVTSKDNCGIARVIARDGCMSHRPLVHASSCCPMTVWNLWRFGAASIQCCYCVSHLSTTTGQV